jgi:hypothetical protein
VATEDGRYLFTCGKDGDIVQSDLQSGKRKTAFSKQLSKDAKGKGKPRDDNIPGHRDELWSIAVSSDGKYLASGGKDRRIGLWDLQKGSWIKGFTGHKDSISVRKIFEVCEYPILIHVLGTGFSERKSSTLLGIPRPIYKTTRRFYPRLCRNSVRTSR